VSPVNVENYFESLLLCVRHGEQQAPSFDSFSFMPIASSVPNEPCLGE